MRHFLCFSRIAQDLKNDAREGVKMRHFRAKSQHLDTLAGARSSKVTRYICKFRAVGIGCVVNIDATALPADREKGGGFQVQTFKYRSRISVAKKKYVGHRVC